MVDDHNCRTMADYRDYLKQNKSHGVMCLESAILVKDALEKSKMENFVMIVYGNKVDSGESSHIFNVYKYRDEMFVCDIMAEDGPYMYNGYLSSAIPFKEYMFILSEIYKDIKMFRDKNNNFWNLTFDVEIENLTKNGFGEVNLTMTKNK